MNSQKELSENELNNEQALCQSQQIQASSQKPMAFNASTADNPAHNIIEKLLTTTAGRDEAEIIKN